MKKGEIALSRFAKVKDLLQRYVDSGRVVGVHAAAQLGGRCVFSEVVGYRDAAAKQPLGEDALYRIFSMTKPITAIAALMLWEEGRFHLGDPVKEYIPAFDQMMVTTNVTETDYDLVDVDRPITVRDLFLHTAGLSYLFADHPKLMLLMKQKGLLNDFEPDYRPLSLAEFADGIAELPLVLQPGTRWQYSWATDVLARLVEVASGQGFAEFLEERLFGPLGMNDTSFGVPKDKFDRLTILNRYPQGAEGGGQAEMESVPLEIDPFVVETNPPRGGHGLVSSAADYGRFCQCLLNGGALEGERILGCRTVDFARANHLPAAMLPFGVENSQGTIPAQRGFGPLGSVILDPAVGQPSLGSVGEYGWGGAAGTAFSIDPEEDLVVMLFRQCMYDTDGEKLWHLVKTGVYQAL